MALAYSPINRGRWAVAGILSLMLWSGCAGDSLRGDRFAEDPVATEARGMRTPDKNNEVWGATNKARQIENDLGVR